MYTGNNNNNGNNKYYHVKVVWLVKHLWKT